MCLKMLVENSKSFPSLKKMKKSKDLDCVVNKLFIEMHHMNYFPYTVKVTARLILLKPFTDQNEYGN